MVRLAGLFLCLLLVFSNAKAQSGAPLRVLMTVGGVGYNTSIIRNLRSDPDIELVVRDVEDHPVLFTSAVLSGVDAVLMYHRDNSATPEEKTALLDFVENGGGVVVLHHALANYPEWERWWRGHVGGLYVLGDHKRLASSRYFYGFSGVARPTDAHFITKRLGASWRYEDESYDQLWVSRDAEILLTTSAFGSQTELAWIGPSQSRRVVYIQQGHGEVIMADPKYLALIEDALRWSARD